MRKVKNEEQEIFTVESEIQINEDTVLEAGDKIQIVNENDSYDNLDADKIITVYVEPILSDYEKFISEVEYEYNIKLGMKVDANSSFPGATFVGKVKDLAEFLESGWDKTVSQARVPKNWTPRMGGDW